MPVGEALAGFVGEVIGYAIMESIFKGLFRAIRSIYRWLAFVLFGVKYPNAELESIKRFYLFKRIELKEALYDVIPKSMRGTVLEIIDLKKAYAEFEKANGAKVSIGEQTIFEVELNKLRLVRVHSARRYRRR